MQLFQWFVRYSESLLYVQVLPRADLRSADASSTVQGSKTSTTRTDEDCLGSVILVARLHAMLGFIKEEGCEMMLTACLQVKGINAGLAVKSRADSAAAELTMIS